MRERDNTVIIYAVVDSRQDYVNLVIGYLCYDVQIELVLFESKKLIVKRVRGD